MRIAVAGPTGNIGGATHKQLRPTRRDRRTGFSLVPVAVGLLGRLLDNGRLRG